MTNITLRELKSDDKIYFETWWRDKDLLKLTSGDLNPISDHDLGKYFEYMLNNKNDIHYIIYVDNVAIGHISLIKRVDGWFETQIIIGDKRYLNKGYGSQAIELLISRAKKLHMHKIYLEVRLDNIRAIKSYTKCGFRVIKTIQHHNKLLPETLRMELQTK